MPSQNFISNINQVKSRILSGIQASGNGVPTLGNYIGAIRQFEKLQASQVQKFFFIADLHSLTTADAKDKTKPSINRNSLTTVAAYMACGITPGENVILYRQSQIPHHTELMWILSRFTSVGQLSRMTQYKDKKQKGSEGDSNAGLLTYPILMASDILLYQADAVPVGRDQFQHLEFTRDVATRFNAIYKKKNNKKNVFTLPKPFVFEENNSKIMSLLDGTKKMSKSDPNPNARIELLDSDDMIIKKIKSAKTDSYGTVKYSDFNELEPLQSSRPEVLNLIKIFSSLRGTNLLDEAMGFDGKNFSELKNELSDTLVESIRPIRGEMSHLLADGEYLEAVLREGEQRAQEVASETLSQVKQLVFN
eukprot:snap_masked-scaffold_7-processed-gene-2.24-mRNA-1 protein AED:0.01 eAED:0.01 QI:0/-1/0/1/-1/1/1/0/363